MTSSLKRRYASKLATRLTSFALGFLTVGIVPRVLGPAQYGNFNFTTTFFANLMKFLTIGTTGAFYTKLSKRPEERTLLSFYAFYTFFLFLLMSIGVAGIFLLEVEDLVWPGQASWVVLAAALLSVLSFASNLVHEVNDAFGLTVRIEKYFMIQTVLSTASILILYLSGVLTLTTYFLSNYALSLFVAVAGWKILRSQGIRPFEAWRLSGLQISAYLKEFYRYSHPLFVHALAVFIVATGDRWLLQHFAGSREQGYFSLAFKLGAMCFLFTSSMSPLFTRELAVSHGKGDMARMRMLFMRFVPLFYFIAAYLAVFVSVNAGDLSVLIGGAQYTGAAAVVAVMALYPIHQTYGHLSGSVFLATGQTRLFRNIGIGTSILGFAASYFLLAPRGIGGLGLGAEGVAAKMIGAQLIVVNIQLWFNAKYLGLSFPKLFAHQAIVLVLMGGLAWCCKRAAPDLTTNKLIALLLNGAAYSVAVGAAVVAVPRLVSLTRVELFVHAQAALAKAGILSARRKPTMEIK